MAITHLTSVSQLNTLLSASDQKLTVIDFYATWCGPCRAIAPTFEELSRQYSNVNFLKCDVDVAQDVASAYGVTAMPTFVFLKGGKQVKTVKGADIRTLQDAFRELTGPFGTLAGRGRPLGGSPSTGNGAGNGRAKWANMDTQFKILLALVAAYIFFWLM